MSQSSTPDSGYTPVNLPSALTEVKSANVRTDLQGLTDRFGAHTHTVAATDSWPVDSIYISISATNPATTFGFGTWVAFGAGKTLVGLNSSETEFDTVQETGGEKTHTLITAELAAHTHTIVKSGGGAGTVTVQNATGSDGTAQATSSTGSGTAHNNLQPYIVVYFWKRTA